MLVSLADDSAKLFPAVTYVLHHFEAWCQPLLHVHASRVRLITRDVYRHLRERAFCAAGGDEADTDEEMEGLGPGFNILGGGPGLGELGAEVGPALMEWFAPLLAAQPPPPEHHAPPHDGT